LTFIACAFPAQQPLAQGAPAHSAAQWLAGFDSVRHSQNIDSEYNYVFRIYNASLADTPLVATVLTALQRLADDEIRLLPHRSDDDQQSAINNLYAFITYFYIRGQMPAAARTGSIAIRVNRQLHQHCTRPYYVLTATYLLLGNTKEALATALEGVRAGETPAGAVNCYAYEAAVMAYFATGDYDKCLEYYQKVVPYFLNADSSLIFDAGHLVFRVTRILLQQHKPVEAHRVLALFTRRLKKTGRIESEMRYYQLAEGDYYHAIGKNDSAERYYQQSLRYLPAGINTARITIQYTMAGFYVDTRQFSRARPLLDTLTSPLARPVISYVNLEGSWLLRHRVDSALGNYRQALASLRQYLLIHDSLINVAKNRQLAEMNVQYETGRKNQHIADLEKQTALQARLQQSADRQNRIVRNSLIAGAALLLLLAALLYSRYRTRQRTNRQLQRLLDDKEWLLREVHHRVKNNLQIIISLLRIQSHQLKDESAISAFEDIGARVNAISLVHKKLYQENQDMASIDLREYTAELVDNLSDGLALQRHIGFRLDIQPITLDVAQCVPLGLILNEAITNAIKYAFPPDTQAGPRPDSAEPRDNDPIPCPEISISLREQPAPNAPRSTGPNPAQPAGSPVTPGSAPLRNSANPTATVIHLLIADNGVGLPAGIDPNPTGSFGLKLIHSLTRQLEGTITTSNNPGLTIHIQFPRADSTRGSLPQYSANRTRPGN
jgi:two-component sensor histidine kinase